MSKFKDNEGNILLDLVRLLVYKKKVNNVQYDTYETGLYAYGSYAMRFNEEGVSQTSWVKIVSF